jgi:hypothetical protein
VSPSPLQRAIALLLRIQKNVRKVKAPEALFQVFFIVPCLCHVKAKHVLTHKKQAEFWQIWL